MYGFWSCRSIEGKSRTKYSLQSSELIHLVSFSSVKHNHKHINTRAGAIQTQNVFATHFLIQSFSQYFPIQHTQIFAVGGGILSPSPPAFFSENLNLETLIATGRCGACDFGVGNSTISPQSSEKSS